MKDLEEFSRLNGRAALDWLDKSEPFEARSVNEWLYLAELGALRVRQDESSREALDWAEVAVRVYEKIASTEAEGILGKHQSLVSAMLVRLHSIALFGPLKSDKIRDPELLIEWFETGAYLPMETAKKMLNSWIDSEEFRVPRNFPWEFLQMMERLDVLGYAIAACRGSVEISSKLKQWLDLVPLFREIKKYPPIDAKKTFKNN